MITIKNSLSQLQKIQRPHQGPPLEYPQIKKFELIISPSFVVKNC